MAREYLSFDNWTLGDTGRHGPMAYHYGRRKMLASYGHYRGLNVMRYPSGAIGPRPALQQVALGLVVSGTIQFVEYAHNGDTMFLISSDGHVYICTTFVIGGGCVWQTVATGITPTVTCIYGGDLYIGAAAGVYRVTQTGTFTGPFINSPATCSFLVPYREVLVGASSDFNVGSFFYSAPGDGTTWPTTNVLGIGTGQVPITGLFAQKNSIVAALTNGEWWTTTGFLTQGGTVGNDITRRADLGPTLPGQHAGTSVMQSTIWYINGRDACNFTGAQTNMEALPDADGLPTARFPTYSVEGGSGLSSFGVENGTGLTLTGIEPVLLMPEAFLVVASSTVGGGQTIHGFLRQGANGWARFKLPLTISPTARILPLVKSVFNGFTFFFTQQGVNVSVYRWQPRLEAPYPDFLGDPLSNFLDGDSGSVVSGSFSIPEWWTPDGGSAHVHGVIVDFEYDPNAIGYAVADGHAASDVVRFNLNVESLNLNQADQSRASTPLPWVPPVAASARTPTVVANPIRRRELFRVGDQGPGAGFRVNLTDMRGVVIYRIVAVVDLEDEKIF